MSGTPVIVRVPQSEFTKVRGQVESMTWLNKTLSNGGINPSQEFSSRYDAADQTYIYSQPPETVSK